MPVGSHRIKSRSTRVESRVVSKVESRQTKTVVIENASNRLSSPSRSGFHRGPSNPFNRLDFANRGQQRIRQHEADIPTQSNQTASQARLSCSDEDEGRPRDHQASPGQRTPRTRRVHFVEVSRAGVGSRATNRPFPGGGPSIGFPGFSPGPASGTAPSGLRPGRDRGSESVDELVGFRKDA